MLACSARRAAHQLPSCTRHWHQVHACLTQPRPHLLSNAIGKEGSCRDQNGTWDAASQTDLAAVQGAHSLLVSRIQHHGIHYQNAAAKDDRISELLQGQAQATLQHQIHTCKALGHQLCRSASAAAGKQYALLQTATNALWCKCNRYECTNPDPSYDCCTSWCACEQDFVAES